MILIDKNIAVMDQDTLNNLLEYSCTVPTGTTIGKRWKRGQCLCVGVTLRHGTCKKHNTWMMGEYVHSLRPGHVDIYWRKILIT